MAALGEFIAADTEHDVFLLNDVTNYSHIFSYVIVS